MTDVFPLTRFKGRLRPSQQEVVEIARRALAEGERRLYIVAPPGSGKTILGLYLWAECVRCPALVLSPNSAIQAQWAARIDSFETEGASAPLVSMETASPRWLTSLTYQSLTLPRSDGDDLEALAAKLWQERLIEKGQAKDLDEAGVWIEDLRRHNPRYYEERLGAYRKEARNMLALGGEALKTLHAAALATLEKLRHRGIGLIILDECHHLMGHWGRVLADAHEFFERPIVIGLTATPPEREARAREDVERYDRFFGPINYDVPVPAVVKDGFLAPYQDLVYFVRPRPEELAFVARADEQTHALVEELCATTGREDPAPAAADTPAAIVAAKPPDEKPSEPSPSESLESGQGLRGGAQTAAGAEDSASPDAAPSLTEWLVQVLAERRLPTGVTKDWASVERRDEVFARAARLFLIQRGVGLAPGVPEPESAGETQPAGEMAVLVPVLDRYIRHALRRSQNPADHQRAERAIQKLRLLGVQITETGSQACASPVSRVLAYSRAKAETLLPILKAERRALGDRIRAVVVTDFEKTSAVTEEVADLLDEEAGGAIAAFRVLLGDPETDALEPALVTGSTVLVDDDLAPKLADGCTKWLGGKALDIQLELAGEQGFKVLTGQGADWCPRVYVAMITDLFQAGLTKCLVGTRGLLGEGWDATKVNVLVDLTTVTTSMSVNQLRGRSIRLDPDDPEKLADNWDVVCLAPEFVKGFDDYRRFIEKHRTLFGMTEDGAIEKGVGHVHAAFTELKPEGVESSMEVLNAEMLGRVHGRSEVRRRWRIGEPYRGEPVQALEVRPFAAGEQVGFPPFRGAKSPWSASSLTLAAARAVLGALVEAGLVRGGTEVGMAERAGGYVRTFLEHADRDDRELFSKSLQEALGPLVRARYVIPRFVHDLRDTWLSRIMPSIVARYFRRAGRRMAMLHAVPAALAKNKDSVAVYQRHWNAHVSLGRALYAYQGEGERLLAQARQTGCVPRGEVHPAEFFR